MLKTGGRSGVRDFGFSPLVLVSGFRLRISDLTLMVGCQRLVEVVRQVINVLDARGDAH